LVVDIAGAKLANFFKSQWSFEIIRNVPDQINDFV